MDPRRRFHRKILHWVRFRKRSRWVCSDKVKSSITWNGKAPKSYFDNFNVYKLWSNICEIVDLNLDWAIKSFNFKSKAYKFLFSLNLTGVLKYSYMTWWNIVYTARINKGFLQLFFNFSNQSFNQIKNETIEMMRFFCGTHWTKVYCFDFWDVTAIFGLKLLYNSSWKTKFAECLSFCSGKFSWNFISSFSWVAITVAGSATTKRDEWIHLRSYFAFTDLQDMFNLRRALQFAIFSKLLCVIVFHLFHDSCV